MVYSGSDVEGKQTARGLEQHYYEQDVNEFGKDNVANRQKPVGENNAKRHDYTKAAREELNKN